MRRYEGKHKIRLRPSAPKGHFGADIGLTVPNNEGCAATTEGSDELLMLTNINNLYEILRSDILKQYCRHAAAGSCTGTVPSAGPCDLSVSWNGLEGFYSIVEGNATNLYAQLRNEYEALQAWPLPTIPHREDPHHATPYRVPIKGPDQSGIQTKDLSTGWSAIAQQFAEVLALAGDGEVGALPVAVGDPAWVGRVFMAHDHCLLVGGRLDGQIRHESTLVRLPRGGPITPFGAPSVGVEVCMETMAMKLSEVRWRQHREGLRPYVTLSASNVAFCFGATEFPAMVECFEHGENELMQHRATRLMVPAADVAQQANTENGGHGRRRMLQVHLRALAPWSGGHTASGTGGTNRCAYNVEIGVSKGLLVTPQQASLPAVVTICVEHEASEHSGCNSGWDEPLILTVSGENVLTMRREVVVL